MPIPAGNGTVTPAAPGLCEAWSPIWTCALPTSANAVTGDAVQMASEVLWALSGRQFGLCNVTIRPCRRECYTLGWNGWASWWEYGTYPTPALINGSWFNITCGSCDDGCSCTRVSDVMLPGPVHEIGLVKVDGSILTKNVDYRLDDYRRLVRLGGAEWPLCNDLNLADDQPNTWSVTFSQGQEVPRLGRVAVGILATEFAKMLICDSSCALPKPVQSLSRQGVNLTFLDPNEVFADGRTGLYVPDMFISTYNPRGLKTRSRAYDVDNLNNWRQLQTG
jgi:hypothetical protein